LYNKKKLIIKKATPAPKTKIPLKTLFKIKVSDVFNKKKIKLQNFLSQIKIYLIFNKALFIRGTNGVLIAEIYFRKKAYEWYSMYL